MRKFKVRSRRSRLLQNRYGKFFIFIQLIIKAKWVILSILALVITIYPLIALRNLTPNILVKKRIFKPGQTIRIIADETRFTDELKCRLKNKEYPFFDLNKTKARALTPIPLEIPSAFYELEIIFKKKLLKKISIYITDPKTKPVKLEIASFKLKQRKHPDVKKENQSIWEIISVKTPKQLWDGIFEIPSNARFSAPFGQKRILPDGSEYFHPGLDIAIVADTYVLASADGVVAHTGDFIVGGRSLYINHGQGVFSMYCHLNDFLVRKGDTVKKGQIVAKSGSTGFSNSPHLHWSVYVSGFAVDPLQWNREIF